MKILGLIHYVKEFGFWHEGSGWSLDSFKQGSYIIRFGFRKITPSSVQDVWEGVQ